MKLANLKYLRGVITVVVATATPFGAYAAGESSLRAAVALGLIAGLTAIGNWLDTALTDPVILATSAASETDGPKA